MLCIVYHCKRIRQEGFYIFVYFCYTTAMKIMIGLRVTREFKDLLQQLAADENRTLSNFLMNAVLTYLRQEKGIEWRKETEK